MGLPDRIGEVIELYGGLDPPLVFLLALEQAQQGGFSPAIAPDQAELPVGVDLEADPLEDGIVAGRIGKGEIFDPDH